jgi:hypothetical protein
MAGTKAEEEEEERGKKAERERERERGMAQCAKSSHFRHFLDYFCNKNK